jgi:hypothetical protein
MRVRFRLFRPEWLDLEDLTILRALFWSLPAAIIGAASVFVLLREYGVLLAFLGAVLAFFAILGVTVGGTQALAHGGARAAASLVLPSGSSTPVVRDFSLEKSLVIRGRVAEAAESLERQLAAAPGDPELCIFAADLYAREAKEPRRAEPLFRRAREAARVSAGQDHYATQRLIDLYLGPLDDEARAAEELRRLIERHPGTRIAKYAEGALRTLPTARPAAGQTGGT